jgi:hypothetical protein
MIVHGMLAVLRSAFGCQVNMVSLPAAGSAGVKGSGLTAQTVYAINQLADGLIIGPGNLFENGALELDLQALAALTVPAMVFSVSTGRIFDRTGHLAYRTDSMSDDRIAAICRAADPVLVRDISTRDHLGGLGYNGARIVGCPTLFLRNPPLVPADPSPALAESVLVSIRHPKLMSIPYSTQGRLHYEIRWIIDHFRARGLDVRLLCHDYQDLPFACAFPDASVLYTEDPLELLYWLRSCRLSITFRLHGFLGCLALGTPSIPVSYDERSISLIETIGLSDWTVSFLHSQCVLAEIQKRCDELPRLQELTIQARPTWEKLYRAMIQGLEQFASRIESHRSRRVY